MSITTLQDLEEMNKLADRVEHVLDEAIGERVGFVLVAFNSQGATVCANVAPPLAISCLYSVIPKLVADLAPPPKLNS
jgi:hypothetical protein